MPSRVQKLTEKGLISPPKWLPSNVMYEVMMGSVAYGVSTDYSDMDVYGFAIPPKEIVFPHLAGEIIGFGKKKERFEQFQQHHVLDEDANGGKGQEYDFSVYNIVKYFQLCMECNPNMTDSLNVPQFCILHITKVGNMVRDNRRMFLHKGAWPKFKGYAYSQLHKMTSKNPKGKRKEIREKYGMDTKFAYHVVRLLDEVEQILATGEVDLQKNREQLKAIRRGEVPEEEIRRWASEKEKDLEKLYAESNLPYSPDEEKIKQLLLHCLEEHYGSLKDAFVNPNAEKLALQQIQDVLDKLPKE
ncbi:MAG: nucleotidyltransferase [Crenarchaeota archaeon]|nr:MAG: nucleotidyltransferase [Thermoproteota archaeon]